MSVIEKWMPSPCYSTSRAGYNKVVLHTTQGAMTIESLGNFFGNGANQVSSHFGADNYQRGVVGAYVLEQYGAWTQGDANPWCLSLEMCGYAEWTRAEWLNGQSTLLHNAADWVAWMCSKYGIPLRTMSNSQAQDPNYRGVCQHVNFGSWGGGHVDCGSQFPMDVVMDWAQGSNSGGVSEMVPGIAVYNNKEYYTWIDGGKVMYRGPDTQDKPVVIDANAGAIAGTNLEITDTGWTFCTFTNSEGDPYVLRRGPQGSPSWERFKIANVA